ncbi:MAG: phasin family protein [Betaproteobacteria bacterium]
MATRKVAKKPALKRTTKSTAAKPRAKVAKLAKAKVAPASVAHKVVQAGLGVAERMQENAVKVYGAIARETGRLSEMTAEAAQSLGKKANVFVKEGQKIQSNVQAVAEAKARDVAKEVKAFAAKSEKSLLKNFKDAKGTVSGSTANAVEGITKLEHVFEARVAKTLNTFGIPSSQNIRELQSRMADLQKALNELNKRGVRA